MSNRSADGLAADSLAPIDDVRLTWRGKTAPPGSPCATFRVQERYGKRSNGWESRLIHGDNLAAMAALQSERSGGIDLIYADPPFATGNDFRMPQHRDGVDGKRSVRAIAYSDRWGTGLDDYLQMLYLRLLSMKRLLSERGSLYLHIDWRVGHYAKVILDEIFGRGCFRNMIVWHYGGRGAKAVAGQFPRNYDMILYYAKSAKSPFHRPMGVRRTPLATASRRGFRRDVDGRWYKTAPRGDYTDASVERLEKEGRIHRTKTGRIRIKYFMEEADGFILEPLPIGDVWDDIPDMMHASRMERTAFPTQKPEALLRRIIHASTEPGDLVADFFCGSGTTLAVAEKLGRRWVGCDESDLAIHSTIRRLTDSDPPTPFSLLKVVE